jgi:Protein of unknown function (DUF4054)
VIEMVAVVFDFDSWITRYPEFANVCPNTAATYFDEASAYFNPTDGSIVKNYVIRKAAMWALIAHIAALASKDRQGIVGRVAEASEGTVRTKLEMGPSTNANDWFKQTQYGASFLRMVAPYTLAHYVAPCGYRKSYPLVDDL